MAQVPVPADWPDAPCGYLQVSAGCADRARLARLRGWPVTTCDDANLPASVHTLISLL